MIPEPPFETAAARPPQGEAFSVTPRPRAEGMPFLVAAAGAVILVD